MFWNWLDRFEKWLDCLIGDHPLDKGTIYRGADGFLMGQCLNCKKDMEL